MSNINLKHKNIIYKWMLMGTFLIAIMITIGGYTRLTKSGLSMTDWRPITGTIPPISDIDWEKEFDKYNGTPQSVIFNNLEKHEKIERFKEIFWPEWFHRLFARFLGFFLILPFIYFYLKKMISKELKKKVAILFFLGASQALIGWYMVKSGLINIPAVSHYRLALHLVFAFILMGYSLWVSLGIGYGNRKIANIPKYIKYIIILILLQICLGAFTAGSNAGKYYNTFPMMDGSILPPEGLLYSFDFFHRNNIGNIQFSHRLFAWTILFISIPYIYKRIKKNNKDNKNNSVIIFGCSLGIQFLLGVLTIIYFNNWNKIVLGIIHQLGATILFLSTISMAYFNTDVKNRNN